MKKFYCFLGLACVFGGINLHAQSTTVPTTFVNGDNDVLRNRNVSMVMPEIL